MLKVLKSYAKTFIKSWVETLGILIFVITLSAIVIGMMATPYQLSSKSKVYERNSYNPETYIQGTTKRLEEDFVFNYFFAGEDYKGIVKSDDNCDAGNSNQCYEVLDQPEALKGSNVGFDVWLSKTTQAYIAKTVFGKTDGILPDINSSVYTNETKASIYSIVLNMLKAYRNGAAINSGIADSQGHAVGAKKAFSDNVNTYFDNDEILVKYEHDILFWIIENVAANKNNHFYYGKNNAAQYSITYNDSLSVSKSDSSSLTPSLTMDLSQALQNEDNTSIDGKWVNPLTIIEGKNVASGSDAQIVLSTKYGKDNNLKLNDTIDLPIALNQATNTVISKTFTIVGFGSRYDTLTPSSNFTFTMDIKNYAYGFVDKKVMQDAREIFWNNSQTNVYFTHDIYVNKTKNYQSGSIKDMFGIDYSRSRSIFKEGNHIFVSFGELYSNSTLSQIKVQVIIFTVLGIVILVLAFVFINFVIKKELNETRNQLGIFKAFGYTIGELSWIFALKTFITILIGLILGYFASVPMQLYVAKTFEMQVTFSYDAIYLNWIFMSIILIIIPIIFLLVSYGLTLLYLKEPALSLIYQTTKALKRIPKQGFISRSLSKKNKGFSYRLLQAFTARSKGKFAMVISLFIFSSLLFLVQLSAQTLLQNTANQGFQIFAKNLDHIYEWNNLPNVDFRLKENSQDVNDSELYIKEQSKWDTRQIGAPIDYSNSTSYENAIDKNGSSKVRYVIHNSLKAIAEGAFEHPEAYIAWDAINNKPSTEMLPAYSVLFYSMGLQANTLDDDKFFNPDKLDFSKSTDLPNWAAAIFGNSNTTNIKPAVPLSSDPNLNDNISVFNLTDEITNSLNGIDGKTTLYITDFARILALQMIQQRVQNYVTNLYNENNNIAIEQIISNVESHKNDLFNYNANDAKNWRMDSDLFNFSSQNNMLLKDNFRQTFGLSFDSMPQSAMQIITTAMMVDDNANPIITSNQLYYDSRQETYAYQVDLLPADNRVTEALDLQLFDQTKFGNINKGINFSGISQKTIDDLHIKNTDNSLNVIVSYRTAKQNNLALNSEFVMKSDATIKRPMLFKVTAINYNDTFTNNIFGDYSAYMTQVASTELNDYMKIEANVDKQGLNVYDAPLFNKIFSQRTLYKGDINLDKITESLMNLRFVDNSVSLTINHEHYIFGSIFNGLIPGLIIDPNKVDKSFALLTNPSLSSLGGQTSVSPMNMLSVVANNAMSRITTTMIIFMILDAFLLLVILVVVMNIIVDEASRIILTMKALGYRDAQINWIVMGNYIIWSIVGFFIAYFLSLIVWKVLIDFIWTKWSILLTLPIDAKTPIISFIVLAIIMVIGWLAANRQVRSKPLTQITNF
ncbi:ABC transporter permease [Spiroplasma endosymbiont of Labia minor]|uniref:ABC transporter permease n=1 Tax=Spiroplasma endosymbiont of Labia minor TaxID=3066305 RepID=UPI0030D196D8